jgi:hypothetical protein
LSKPRYRPIARLVSAHLCIDLYAVFRLRLYDWTIEGCSAIRCNMAVESTPLFQKAVAQAHLVQ